MRNGLRQLYWLLVALLSLLVSYESLTKEIYGDNSLWLAVVFLGVAVFSSARMASTGRLRRKNSYS